MEATDADFSGWATVVNLKCSDGRTIMPEAFSHMDGARVPLVWAHKHDEPENVMGHAILSARPEGIWAEAYFNDTSQGKTGRALVQHRDVESLSIYANGLVEKSKQVFHGMIRELSLVLSGANPGAKIQNIRMAHSDDLDDYSVLDDEAIIWTGLELHHTDSSSNSNHKQSEEHHEKENAVFEGPDENQKIYDSMSGEQREMLHSMLEDALSMSGDDGLEGVLEHAEDQTVKDVYDSLTEVQKNVVHYMIGAALEAAENNSASHAENTNEGDLIHKEGITMSRNVFEDHTSGANAKEGLTLSHSDMKAIQESAIEAGSYKKAFLAHAEAQGYGIEDIEFLFPDAKTVTNQPDLIARRTEWVKGVLDGAKHSPFARVKSIHGDLTAEQARAKGYVKGTLKKDEVIKLLKRVTTPTTIYKKQKLDRDDIIDITDLDVVAWLKWEMRFMLEEELARAILIGDGREPDDADKINEDHLRPIAHDNEMYTHPVLIPSETDSEGIVESVLRARKHYKGTGTPTFYTTDDILTDMLLIKDKIGRRLYGTEAELAAALRVNKITVVEVMEDTPDLLGILVNMADYTIGADKGGQLAMFDDFDIDYNQNKYLIETRISGALTKAKSAVVIKRTSGQTVVPQTPAFDAETNTITVPNQAGVRYFDVTSVSDEVALVNGASVVITKTTDIEARPQAGYNFPHNTDADWVFAYTA